MVRALSDSELFEAWERGFELESAQRPLAFLQAVYPDTEEEELLQWSIGRCNADLVSLRQGRFGSQMEGVVSCPKCGQTLELTFSTAEICAEQQENTDHGLTVSKGDYRLWFRLPTAQDLADAARLRDHASARTRMLEACLMEAKRNDEKCSLEELPETAVTAMVKKMEEADTQGSVLRELSCPECDHQWQTTFDIGAFLWTETDAWARRMLRDVHTLASAYGWQEEKILKMTPRRRQFYLDMVNE